MKIIFFSDLHNDIDSLERLVSREEGIFYCLGDSELSNEQLKKYNIISVKGNCDNIQLPNELIIEIENKKVLLTHGHMFNVKFTLNNLYYHTKSSMCNIVIFGHTHRITKVEEDITMYNPGSIRDNGSYIVFENDKFEIKYL
ncbi:MAG: YfcE family phosphodiesterase [bacterium]